MSQGWIKLHRKSLESSVFQASAEVWKVWCWCLMKASHEGNKFPFNGRDMEIESGEFVSGRNKACLELGLSPQQFRTSVAYLIETGRISRKSTNKFTVFKVMKWASYQLKDILSNQPLTNEQPTTNQPITTIKNVKNVKNAKTVSKDTEATPRKEKNIHSILPNESMSSLDDRDRSFPRKRTWGDEKIDWTLDYTEHLLTRSLTGTERWNRIYAKHLATKYGMSEVRKLLEFICRPESWWFDKISQMSTIYKNADKLFAEMAKPLQTVTPSRRARTIGESTIKL